LTEELKEELWDLREQNDKLREALRDLVDCTPTDILYESGTEQGRERHQRRNGAITKAKALLGEREGK
jgi:hypothetical protein